MKITLLILLTLCTLESRSQKERLAILHLNSPVAIKLIGDDYSTLLFLDNLRDTLFPNVINEDTFSYFTHEGIVRLKRSQETTQLSYYFSGVWQKTPLHPVFKGDSNSMPETFYKDQSGNIVWLKWSQTMNLPFLYSPYRKYRSYLIPLGQHEYLNSHGDRVKINGAEMSYSVEGFTESVVLNSFDPFERDEVYVVVHGDSLFGYLYRPVGIEKPAPACLLLQGGGSVGINNYLLEAEFLAAHGVATAIFNKSGEERSGGTTNFRFQSFDEKLEEYAELFKWLRSIEGIDSARTGIHGMSEGGRLSVDLAAMLGEAAVFVNSVSGPFSSFADSQLYAINRHLHGSLWPDSIISATTALWARYFYEATTDSISPKTQKDISDLRILYPQLYLPPSGERPASDLLKEDINFTSYASLKEVESPIFFQLAELDNRVDVHRSVNSINTRPENTKDWLRIYPETSHGMTDNRGNITAGYLYDKVEWLKSIKILNP